MIRVGIVDDQAIVRQGLAMVLGNQEDIEMVGQAEDGLSAIQLCEGQQPEVLLMDIKMPGLNGVEATRIIKERHPHIHIIILTTFNEEEYIFEALKYGAGGYLLKDAQPAKIAEAIREVHGGGALIQPDVAAKVVEQFRSEGLFFGKRDPRIKELTQRELELIALIGQGKNNREIAQELFISEGTVKNHLSHILSKLDLRDRTQV